MAAKRQQGKEGESTPARKKAKTGFSVGPANLPDGSYKRKAQKIKRNLIEKAKTKAQYAKIKAREPRLHQHSAQQAAYGDEHNEDRPQGNNSQEDAPQPASTEPHPSRQALISSAASVETTRDSLSSAKHEHEETEIEGARTWMKRPKKQPFATETRRAERAKAEADKRREEITAAKAERERRRGERDRWRKAMEKSKKGRDGKAKLGRQSKVLLEKVERLVKED